MILAILAALPGLFFIAALCWGMVEDHRRQIELGNQLVADAIRDAYLNGWEDGMDEAESCIEQP